MRKTNIDDLFNLSRLIMELDLKEDLFKAQQGKEDVEKIGFDFLFSILAKATTKEAQMKIYEVLANPFERTPQEVGTMALDEMIQGVKECFDFSVVANFLKRAN
jgi:hypothetical protein